MPPAETKTRLSPAQLTELDQILARHAGWKDDAAGLKSLQSAVAQRRSATHTVSFDAYLALVKADPRERNLLIEELAVPETWFFRDNEPFRQLERWLRSDYLPKHGARDGNGSVLRVLSLPCSTGEEPYSIAIALLDAGLPPERFLIDAMDISDRALTRAREGRYRKLSFRGTPALMTSRHFEPARLPGARRDEFCVRGPARERVMFSRGNLLDPSGYQATARYHVIFCRNALIYFHREGRELALNGLARLLLPGGLLCVGHADSIESITDIFRPVGPPAAFTYVTRERAGRHSPRPAATPTRAFARVTPVAAATAAVIPPATAAHERPAGPSLDEALRLANSGNLDEATVLCEQHLKQNGPCAVTFTLLGTVKFSARDLDTAARLFEKALYLEPRHYEALVQLALVRESQGNRTAAEALRNRIQRLSSERATPVNARGASS